MCIQMLNIKMHLHLLTSLMHCSGSFGGTLCISLNTNIVFSCVTVHPRTHKPNRGRTFFSLCDIVLKITCSLCLKSLCYLIYLFLYLETVCTSEFCCDCYVI